jgi:hypothetical protein
MNTRIHNATHHLHNKLSGRHASFSAIRVKTNRNFIEVTE